MLELHHSQHISAPSLRAERLARRKFLKLASSAAALSLVPAGAWADSTTASSASFLPQQLVRFPEKTDLILLTDRPPQLETPLKYFRSDLTGNDAFFVRWHLANIPTEIDTAAFRLSVGGHVQSALSLSLDDLKKFDAASVVAVCQCSGNSRSFFSPRVPGGQWQNGAMGNARWTGARLKDLLAKAGVKDGAVQVSFQGLDRPVLPATPQFIKSLHLDVANNPDILVAYAMNDQPLPMLNGFPVRLIVPGWFATYWVKALNEVSVLDKPLASFWMDKAYRVPKNPEMNENPKELARETVPISTMPVRSVFVSPEPGGSLAAGSAVEGVAFDAGSGIAKVEVSADGGKTWETARLVGADMGKYAWRRWAYDVKLPSGTHTLMARATSNGGETQPAEPRWNRSGYARNVIEKLTVTI